MLLLCVVALATAQHETLYGFPTPNIRLCNRNNDCRQFGDAAAICIDGFCECSTSTFDHRSIWSGHTLFMCNQAVGTNPLQQDLAFRTVDSTISLSFPQATCANVTGSVVAPFRRLVEFNILQTVISITHFCDPSRVIIRANLTLHELYNVIPRVGSEIEWALLLDSNSLQTDLGSSLMMAELGPIDHSQTYVASVNAGDYLCDRSTMPGSALNVIAAGKCASLICEATHFNWNGKCVPEAFFPRAENRGFTGGVIAACIVGGVFFCVLLFGIVSVCCLSETPVDTEDLEELKAEEAKDEL